ncbi:MAG: efflux RND transporter permease subunit [Tepidisphaerales bacterium]
MWIVRLALRRPYTFVVAAMLVAILGIFTILQMPTDIFPDIDIPVISVLFSYTGISADDMEKRIVTPFERFLVTVVNDIDHIESQSLNGIGVVKVFFQKGAKIEAATAQVTAVSQSAIRIMPPGTVPPLVIRYSASNVPILQLSIGSDKLPEQQLFDSTINFLRTRLITIPGAQIPYPYGGRQRQIMVDLDPEKLFAWGISPADVSNAVNAQNLILPSGSAKIGKQEYQVRLNSSPEAVAALNDLPIKTVNGTTVYIRDVAHVRDGFQVQQSVVHANGRRGVLLSILKNGAASTLDVVSKIKEMLPEAREQMPNAKDMKITSLFDQSIFVRAAVEGVITEAAIAAGLTGLMILLFLGSWRSTLIVIISIPLSILVSIIALAALGHTLNVMTLGGMALAVGILVDDATVEIENIHRNLHQRKRLVQAILDGASQIAVPAFVSTLCICIVFVPVVFISGAAKYLFTPLAMAVVFAMLTSYILSRTLVPTMVHYLLAAEVEMYGGQLDLEDPHATKAHGTGRPRHWLHGPAVKLLFMLLAAVLAGLGYAILRTPLGDRLPQVRTAMHAVGEWAVAHRLQAGRWAAIALCGLALLWLIARYSLVWRIHFAFDHLFEKMRRLYGGLLAWALGHPSTVVIGFTALVVVSCGLLFPRIGTDFFPTVDAGQMRMHVRCPPGTRLEETEHYFTRVEQSLRRLIPEGELDTLLDNIGIPNSSINLSLSDGTLVSAADGEILVSLKEPHAPSAQYMRKLRRELAREYPDLTFFFASADIATQVLNFGLSSPIDIQVAGPLRNLDANYRITRQIQAELAAVPGIVDVRMQQVRHTPDIRIDVDRTLADQVGLTQKDVANDLLISLSSSNQTAPNFWFNPQNGVNYNILVQTPQREVTSISDLESTPIVAGIGSGSDSASDLSQLLGSLASLRRGSSPTNITHLTTTPTFDVLLGVQGADLGSVSRSVRAIVAKYRQGLPAGSSIELRGQIESMQASFSGLAYGLIFAVILVYLLMVINFQSWLDPMIILMALPGAAAGILWMLWATSTTISVPALMGAIMSIGVATANSILMITFANDQRKVGFNAHDAALSAGMTRLRPVVMTALAMVIGMLPMSLGLGEGGEQNAPLGRAVIGGLLMATVATLFFVPVVYSLLRRKAPQTQVEKELR